MIFNVKEINREYKERFAKIAAKLGRVPTSQDPEYWTVTDWYRDQFDAERQERIKEDREEKRKEAKLAAEPVKVIEKLCKVCNALMLPTGKRGRPATICADCKPRKKK